VTLGGSSSEDAAIGKIVGPSFSSDQIVHAIDTVVETYMANRAGGEERFIDTYRRIGIDPFKEALYGPVQARRPTAQ
jgi:sulfite reductase (NADPH) hemoprotein beta-component